MRSPRGHCACAPATHATPPERNRELTGMDRNVTLIVPVYNKEGTLERSVRSALDQTEPPSRIILVDDKSTDRSAEIGEAIAAREPTVELLRLPENKGAAYARNRGAQAAASEWIAFLDADDHWHPAFLERVLDGAATSGADFASSGRIQVDSRGPVGEQTMLIEGERFGAVLDLTNRFWEVSSDFVPINSSANLIRRSLFLSVGGFEEKSRYWEDHILWSRLWRAGRFAFVNEPLSQYYKAPATLSAGPFFYRDAIRFQRELVAGLAQCRRERRPGGFHLLLYLARFSVLLPAAWASRLLRRREVLRSASIGRPRTPNLQRSSESRLDS
jgi:glycosyltransferase involved in cell wall biosynthesis